jgi:hypothetical protein
MSEIRPQTIPNTDYPPSLANRINSSFISDISHIESDYEMSEVHRIAMDFESLKLTENHIIRPSFKRKFNHMEMKELNNRERLWE